MTDETPDIPDFELIREIGRGGFGQVWLARNRATGLLRAVKLISRSSVGTVDPAGREVVSITRLEAIRHRHHPNLLDIQHVGQTDDYVFFVTDLADDVSEQGGAFEDDYVPVTLEGRLKSGPLPADECLECTRQLLEGLASLHEAGMVHRDVKPANCLFVDGTLKLADFGLLTEADSHTSRIGTQAYMPPDGCMDTRADVYAAGLVIYEMITGHCVERFPQLADRADDVGDEVTLSALLRVCLDACQRAREERFDDASVMLGALERSIDSAARPVRALRQVVIALACILVVGGLVWGGVRSFDRPSDPGPVETSRVHVNFVSYPFGATVLLDGEVVLDAEGQPVMTPCTIEGLAARPHDVVFQHGDLPDLEFGAVDFGGQRQVVGAWEPTGDEGVSR